MMFSGSGALRRDANLYIHRRNAIEIIIVSNVVNICHCSNSLYTASAMPDTWLMSIVGISRLIDGVDTGSGVHTGAIDAILLYSARTGFGVSVAVAVGCGVPVGPVAITVPVCAVVGVIVAVGVGDGICVAVGGGVNVPVGVAVGVGVGPVVQPYEKLTNPGSPENVNPQCNWLVLTNISLML